eukprot:4872744-Amphidinium_carterae.1
MHTVMWNCALWREKPTQHDDQCVKVTTAVTQVQDRRRLFFFLRWISAGWAQESIRDLLCSDCKS